METVYKTKELKHEGLCYEWEVSVPAKPIVDKLEADLNESQKTFKMAGYRDGKVPMQMVRKQMGPELLSKIIEHEVDDTLRKILTEKNLKPALQPVVEIKSFDDKSDLVFTAKVEYLPEVPKVEWDKIEIETFKVEASQEDLDKALGEIKDKFKTFKEADAKHVAKKGDAVIIDFHGTVNGEEFEGNKAEGIRLELGSGQFIPGFEDQLIGAKAGDEIKVRVSFPKNYTNKSLSGKPAVFEVKIKQVLMPESVDEIDNAFAEKLGLESVEKLLELIKEKITADFNGLARLSMKKKLFDKIDAVYRFEVPEGMIGIDFDTMWGEIKSQKQANPSMFKGKNEEEMKKEYKEIAKRRVRLGIILAEIARDHDIEVLESDLQQAIFSEAMMRPGQEKIVMEFYSKPENLERLKGPILEEKAVDHILSLVQRKEIEISSKEFFDKYAEEIGAMEKAS
ncbi:MAG: trigger factor [Candidatus Jidaibacter sp.]|jgi:trigger factor|nr:trigger factor [Candidatus Jidaibacter sp.]